MLAGNATDVILDADSAVPLDPNSNPGVTGNLQVVFAGMQGQGVFMSPNQGQVWNLMTGNVGNPLIIDTITGANVSPIVKGVPTSQRQQRTDCPIRAGSYRQRR